MVRGYPMPELRLTTDQRRRSAATRTSESQSAGEAHRTALVIPAGYDVEIPRAFFARAFSSSRSTKATRRIRSCLSASSR